MAFAPSRKRQEVDCPGRTERVASEATPLLDVALLDGSSAE